MARDRVSGLFWLAVALFAAVQGFSLGLGGLHRPGIDRQFPQQAQLGRIGQPLHRRWREIGQPRPLLFGKVL